MTGERVQGYLSTWKGRCYSDDIPEEVPAKVAASGRAPSYKALAIAILKGDMQLLSLGFEPVTSKYYEQLRQEKRERENPQATLF